MSKPVVVTATARAPPVGVRSAAALGPWGSLHAVATQSIASAAAIRAMNDSPLLGCAEYSGKNRTALRLSVSQVSLHTGAATVAIVRHAPRRHVATAPTQRRAGDISDGDPGEMRSHGFCKERRVRHDDRHPTRYAADGWDVPPGRPAADALDDAESPSSLGA